ncbi:unnamed protein product [Effrenium voratum]|uniref:Cyclic nucleotide-binding domain-containing protein n=1 Tax=Effrenium voratum TaxID=2562239 RepID=A0AA36MZW1_9DINO|nr:unnamed protein product [Effrenium voratum]
MFLDRIICAGDMGTELYFVAVGEVLPGNAEEKGVVIKTLHEGSFFGECGGAGFTIDTSLNAWYIGLGLLFPDSKHKGRWSGIGPVDFCGIGPVDFFFTGCFRVDVYGATAGWLLVVPRGTLESLCSEELLETFRPLQILKQVDENNGYEEVSQQSQPAEKQLEEPQKIQQPAARVNSLQMMVYEYAYRVSDLEDRVTLVEPSGQNPDTSEDADAEQAVQDMLDQVSNHGATTRGTSEFFSGEGFRLSEDSPDVTRAHFVDLQDGELRLESFSDMMHRLMSQKVSRDEAFLALQNHDAARRRSRQEQRLACVAIERLRKPPGGLRSTSGVRLTSSKPGYSVVVGQPEMADGMMECPKPKDPKPQRQAISSRSSSSQDTSSEEWNPHTEETEVNLNAAAEIEPEPSQVRRSRSLSWGQLREGIQGPQLKRLMTCRTEVFRRPHIFQRRDARCIDPLIEPMELVNTMHTGVGHAGRRASMRIAQESQEVGSNHGTPRMLFALHKVENGMNNLLTRMNTMEKSMSSNRSAEPVKPGKAAEAG